MNLHQRKESLLGNTQQIYQKIPQKVSMLTLTLTDLLKSSLMRVNQSHRELRRKKIQVLRYFWLRLVPHQRFLYLQELINFLYCPLNFRQLLLVQKNQFPSNLQQIRSSLCFILQKRDRRNLFIPRVDETIVRYLLIPVVIVGWPSKGFKFFSLQSFLQDQSLWCPRQWTNFPIPNLQMHVDFQGLRHRFKDSNVWQDGDNLRLVTVERQQRTEEW